MLTEAVHAGLACSVRDDLVPRAFSYSGDMAGPGVYICDGCIALAGGVVGSGSTADTPLGPMRAVPERCGGTRCRFCAKRRDHVTALAAMPAGSGDTFAGPAAICMECLSLCNEILAEELA